MKTWLDRFGSFWAGLEDRFWAVWRRARRKQRRFEAEARLIGAEILDWVDDLPFVPSLEGIIPVKNQFYGHGAFMGAAPALLADPKWKRILAFLMPDVYQDVSAVVAKGGGAHGVIPMFENNPVMCAFGVYRNVRDRSRYGDRAFGAHDLEGVEWDVFIDGELVDAWLQADDLGKGALLAKVVDTMVIAHASTTDTVQEAIGLCQYRDVRATPKTRLGGVEPAAWMDLFARALELASAEDLTAALVRMSSEPRDGSEEECRKYTFLAPRPMRDAVDVFRRVTGRPRFSVVLEIKSLRSTPELLVGVVAELNRRGVHVAGVGSFLLAEIAGVGATRQRVDGEDYPGPREVLFMHFAGDLQHACDENLLPNGQSVMFNGASLLDLLRDDPESPPRYAVRDDVIAELGDYVAKHDLHVGLYVQEGDCDAVAASLISEIASDTPAFDLGFAWGGLLDEAGLTGGGGDRRGFGGQKMLGTVGRARDWRTKRERAPAPGAT